MSSAGWMLRGALVVIGWAWLGLGLAQAGVISPTKPDLTLDGTAPVTLSLYQLDSTLPSTVTLNSPSRCTTTGTAFYRDVTDCWLPEWEPVNLGKSLFIVVTGSTDILTLVPPPPGPFTFPGTGNPFLTALTTSAYPGQCTNFGSGTEADFELIVLSTPMTLRTSPTTSVEVRYELKPRDCGGMAVIQVGSFKFILPKDGTGTGAANGIPEIWENLYGGNLDPAADIDTGPLASSPCCDGISTFDEYRGFIVSGRQIRTDPKQKDVFLHLVNPQPPPPTGVSFLGSGTTTYPTPIGPSATLTLPGAAGTPGAIGTFTVSPAAFSNAHTLGEIIGNMGVGRAKIITVLSPTSVTAEITQPFLGTTPLSAGSWKLRESLFANVYSLVPPAQVHLLGYAAGAANANTNEWVDNFTSLTGTTTLSVGDFVSDRTVNPNRVYGAVQKGLRVIESLATTSPSTLGWSYGTGSPNSVGNLGNVIVYTQNIITYFTTNLIGTATTLNYSTASLVGGVLTWSSATLVPDGDPMIAQDGVATNLGVRNFIISKAMQFYTAMEVGHSLNLTPGVQGTTKTTYGHHLAPSTGDCLDKEITTTPKGGTVTFNIPSLCGSADQGAFLLQ